MVKNAAGFWVTMPAEHRAVTSGQPQNRRFPEAPYRVVAGGGKKAGFYHPRKVEAVKVA